MHGTELATDGKSSVELAARTACVGAVSPLANIIAQGAGLVLRKIGPLGQEESPREAQTRPTATVLTEDLQHGDLGMARWMETGGLTAERAAKLWQEPRHRRLVICHVSFP